VIEVHAHDVAADPPPPGAFDLVPARLVLVHVTDRAEALRRMVRALRPGGLLLLEDADPALQPLLCPDESGPDQRLANRLRAGFRTLMATRGADLAYGRTLPRVLREAGLDDLQADAYLPVTSPACAVLEDATVRQIRGRLTAQGLAVVILTVVYRAGMQSPVVLPDGSCYQGYPPFPFEPKTGLAGD
jgi:SAM-dependent methyltransferase